MTTRAKWRLIQTVFTLSGGAALAYEVVWGRWLVTVLGGSTQATCVVLACYMGGLALGAWFFGRLSDKTAPLRLYVWIEILVAAVAVLFPGFASAVLGLPGVARVAASVVMLLIPTFLMGGTLPLVVAWTERAGLPEGSALGRLYGLNTVGAAAGCLAAGLWGIPTVGLSGTNAFAASLNSLIAIVVFWVFAGEWRGAEQASPEETESARAAPSAPEAGAVSAWPMHLVAFLSGLATLGIEVIWIRLLRITLGSTTYTFTLVIATFILGLGCGGLWAGRTPETAPAEPRLARAQLLLVFMLSAQFVALPWTPAIFQALRFEGSRWNGALVGSGLLCLLLLLPVTLVIGYLFPLLGRLYMRGGQRGRDVGRLYTVNTTGAVAGALVTTLALVPWLGSTGAMLLLTGLMLVSLGIYRHLALPDLAPWVSAAAVAAVAVFAGLVVMRPGWTPDYLGYGAGWTMKMTGSENLFFKEGRSSTVVVEAYPRGRIVRIDGKPVASTLLEDKANQLLLGHVPAVLTSQPRRGLVVGLGTGMTLGALALHELDELHLVELEPQVAAAARFFDQHNYNVMDRDELQIHFDDGFNFLHATDMRFEVITSDPIQPHFRGAATLYSVDYFARASERLTENGVMAHWLPLGNLKTSDFKMIVRTFTDVFPYARIYWTGSTTDAILVGRNTPWRNDEVDRRQYELAATSLKSICIDSAEEIASLLMAERAVLRAWAGERGLRNTVEMPMLEFTAAQNLYSDTRHELLNNLLRMRRQTLKDHPVWRATTIALAYKAQLSQNRHGAQLLWSLLASEGCDVERADCAPARQSGLLRRLVWNHAMAEAGRSQQRAYAHQEIQKTWWYGDDPPEAASGFEEGLSRAIDFYQAAKYFASDVASPERAAVDERLAELMSSLPEGSPYADRLRALQAAPEVAGR